MKKAVLGVFVGIFVVIALTVAFTKTFKGASIFPWEGPTSSTNVATTVIPDSIFPNE